MSVKLALDIEIATYCKLLEGGRSAGEWGRQDGNRGNGEGPEPWPVQGASEVPVQCWRVINCVMLLRDRFTFRPQFSCLTRGRVPATEAY